MAREDRGNTAQVFGGASGDTVQFKKGEARPFHAVIVMDATASRDATIDAAKANFKDQMERLQTVVENLSSVENLRLTLATFGGNKAPVVQGPFDTPQDVSAAFDQVQCEEGVTSIAQTFELLRESSKSHEMAKIDAAIYIGDTSDSGRHYQQHFIHHPDNLEALESVGTSVDFPIITMLDHTTHTQGYDVLALQTLSESTGIMNCPIDYRSEITFVDMLAATIALKAEGPKALDRLIDRGLVSDKVRDHIAPETQKTIYKPDRERSRRRGFPLWPWLAAGVAGLALLSGCPRGGKNPVAPAPIAPEKTIAEEFKEDGGVTFDDLDTTAGFFASDSAALNPEALPILDQLGAYLQKNPQDMACVNLIGHTDSTGSDAYNQRLSEARSAAVFDYLHANYAIDLELLPRGAGESQLLIDPEMSEDDKARNRRVEITRSEFCLSDPG